MPDFHADEVKAPAPPPAPASGGSDWWSAHAPKTSTKSLDKDGETAFHKVKRFAETPLVDTTKLKAERAIPGTGTASKVAKGITEGLESSASGLTSPENIALMVGTWGLGAGEAGLAVRAVKSLVSAGFGVDQLKAAWDKIQPFREAIKKGDTEGAARIATEGLTSAVMGGSALAHGAKAKATPEAKVTETRTPPPVQAPPARPAPPVTEPKIGPLAGTGEPETQKRPTPPLWAKAKEVKAKPAPKEEAPAPSVVPVAEEKKPVQSPTAFSAGYAEGKTGKAKVARGYKIPFTYAVVDADNLITSHEPQTLTENPAFDQSIQPRDRSRAGYEEQINTMVGTLDPEELGHSYKASDGAPIVGNDAMVESGNGRTIALKRIYASHPEKAKEYGDWLKDNAKEFGLDAKEVEGVKNPVLVRLRTELPEGVTRADFGQHANEDTKATLGGVETAMADAKALTPELMSLFEPSETGDVNTADNRAFVQKFAQAVVSPGQKNPFMLADGSISAEGIRRIRNAVFAKAYGGSSALDKLAEDPSDNTKAITNGLVIAAPKFADMQSAIERGDLHDLNPSPAISRAVSRLTALRSSGTPIRDFLNQENLYGTDPMEGLILDIFDRYKRSAKNIGKVFRYYTDLVEELGSPKQASMFGGETPTMVELLKTADDKVKEEQAAKNVREEESAPPLLQH